MKKVFVSLLFVAVLHGVNAQVERDKVLHFVGGNLFGLAGAGIAKQISDGNRWWTFAGAIGGSSLIGLGKEAVDAGQRENGWDNDDLLATILGGVTVGVTIDIFTDHKKGRRKKNTAVTLFKDTRTFDQMLRLEQLLQEEREPTLLALSLPAEVLGLERLQ